jgi:hypothetical protein
MKAALIGAFIWGSFMAWVMAEQDPLEGALWGAISGAVFGYVISLGFDAVDFTNTPKRFMNKLNITGPVFSRLAPLLVLVVGTLWSFDYASKAPAVYQRTDGGYISCAALPRDRDRCIQRDGTVMMRFGMGLVSTVGVAGALWLALGAGKPEE